ncbi:FKBP12-associated protein [Toensbergia leucococca]|nr:FKBP12-associated protein [Toensbergia leucococca]
MFITCECQHLKQETKCNASKTSEGNSKKSLNCDDECARLARNRKLALALNIDPEEHKDEHIPYAMDTLYMFQEGVKWAQIQEREFRVFAADEAEKRLRFKPMPPHQRAFIHSLADDFGFDSESMDPEPHRHVAIFKTPRFVMAPMKTLAECVRIRTSAEASSTTIAEAQKKLNAHNEPYNGFLLTGPRFGLTLEDLRADLSSTLKSSPSLVIDISFLPSEEIVLKAHSISASTTTPSPSIEAILRAMKPALSATILSNHLAVSIQLCALDSSLNILRRELSEINANGGWSHVAAKGAAPRQAPKLMAVGEKSVYTVLGSKMRDAKRKEKEERKREREAVVDDWEEEARKEEAEEEEKWGGVGKGVEVESQRVEADGELAEDYDPENKVMNEDTTARDEGSTTTAKDEATEPLHHKSELPTSTTNKDADAIDVSNQSALPRPPQ